MIRSISRSARRVPTSALLAAAAFALFTSCGKGPGPGEVTDEARQAGRDAASFSHADEDYFKEMDGGLALDAKEIQGRNMWLVWSGGNDRFWDRMTDYTFGAFDLLKIVSSHPSLGYNRENRWPRLGLVNEPCFDPAAAADPKRFGLWLDVRRTDCAADPFENETKYPGVALGGRGKNGLPVGSFYGYATGIMGLRLFPNPAFDEKAAKAWDAQRYYTDPSYYNRKDLVRPYRVGMSCGFCHVGPSPVNPPADPSHPRFPNLSSSVGAQYMWVDRLFIFNADKPEGRANFMYQLAHTYRPGSMDTSLVSTDSINNPRTMNAVYDFVARMGTAKKLWHEPLAGGELDNKQFNDYVKDGPLAEYFDKGTKIVKTPHVLKDGADSVGLLGALNRVYLNIGLFSEEWLLHFNPVVGGKDITPIRIADAQKNSSYWNATERGNVNTALFFLKAARPDHLKDAPGGAAHLAADDATLARGKIVFADTCARCHSSKAPEPPPTLGLDPARCAGAGYLDCYKRWWTWTQGDDFKARMRELVQASDFLDGNYLFHRSPRARHAAAHQRLQPAGDERAGRQHLGQLLVPGLQEAAFGRHADAVRPVHRRAPALRDAGRRPRVHAGAVADQRLVHRALPAQQHRRAVQHRSVGRGTHEGVQRVDRADALARAPAAGRALRRQGPRHHRPHRRAQPGDHPRRLRAGEPLAAARLGAPLASLAGRRRRRHRARPDPEGHADRRAGQPQDPLGERQPRRTRRPCEAARRVRDQAQGGPRDRPRRRDRRGVAQALRQPARAHAQAQQVPRPGRQSGALFRHRVLQSAGRPERRREGLRHRARAERRGEARPDRLPEDVLSHRLGTPGLRPHRHRTPAPKAPWTCPTTANGTW
ncbi:hypothetical protein ACFJIX_23500 [Roseateles sp. UC29_93]|uniref:hypothetical protein n=1 Tax=Roseateles sp. UC29_93 TaxID=3350177 RepID=UPI00366BECD4